MIKDLVTGAVRDTIDVEAEGERSADWTKVSIDGTRLELSRKVRFASKLARKSDRSGVVTEYATEVKTLDDLSIDQLSVDSDIQSLRFSEGSVLSSYQVSQKLLVTYEDLLFESGKGTCLPQSGDLKAKLFTDETLKDLVLSYTVRFDRGSATLIFEDGTKRELDLVDCLLK